MTRKIAAEGERGAARSAHEPNPCPVCNYPVSGSECSACDQRLGAGPQRGSRWEADVLAYDPFAGDRDVDVRVFRDAIVKARKAGVCNTCGEQIQPGSLIRSRTETCDGQIGTFRFCASCCDAMALSWTDDGAAMEAIEEKRYLAMRVRAEGRE